MAAGHDGTIRLVTTGQRRMAWVRAYGPLFGIVALGILLRLASIRGPGYSGDVGVLSAWAEDMARNGLAYYHVHLRSTPAPANYPPLLYLLWPLGLAFDGEALRIAIRAASIPFDIAIGLFLFAAVRGEASRLGRASPEVAGRWAAGLYLLNPGVILDGPLWGQVDGIAALPMIVAIWLTARRRFMSGAAMAALAGLIKPQFGVAAIVLGGALLWDLRSRRAWREAALAVAGGAAAYAAVMVPLGVGPRAYLALLRSTTDRFHYMSVSGFNPWLAVFGYHAPDGPAFLVGIVLTLLVITSSLLLLRRRRDLIALLAVATVMALTLYFVPTRVHERHLFGAIALLAPLAALVPALRVPYATLSAAFALSLAYVLGTNTPPGFPIPAWLATRGPLEVWLLTGMLVAAATWCLIRLTRTTLLDAAKSASVASTS